MTMTSFYVDCEERRGILTFKRQFRIVDQLLSGDKNKR